jgi:hypothetical protein
MGGLHRDVLEVILDGLRDGIGPHALPRPRGSLRSKLSRTLLGLPEGENVRSVSVGEVVGRADPLNHIVSITNIDARDPTSSIFAFAIANVKAGTDRAPVRLASDLQFQPCIAAVQNAFADTACHGGNPVLSNIVQYPA